MDLGIIGRRAAVAAASAGLGRAAARALARDGAHVAICGRHTDTVDATVADLRAEGGDVVGLVADVSTTAGATVNSIQPGLHATDRLSRLHGGDLSTAGATVPVGHVGDPDDFGAAVAFLCSEPAGFITGSALAIDGGAFPGLQ